VPGSLSRDSASLGLGVGVACVRARLPTPSGADLETHCRVFTARGRVVGGEREIERFRRDFRICFASQDLLDFRI